MSELSTKSNSFYKAGKNASRKETETEKKRKELKALKKATPLYKIIENEISLEEKKFMVEQLLRMVSTRENSVLIKRHINLPSGVDNTILTAVILASMTKEETTISILLDGFGNEEVKKSFLGSMESLTRSYLNYDITEEEYIKQCKESFLSA